METQKSIPAIRHRVTLSCAECKRLKLKCDRSFPCANCIRRNCGSICPTGVNAPSKRISKASVHMAALSQRVIELEAIMSSNGLDGLIPEPLDRIISSGSSTTVSGSWNGIKREPGIDDNLGLQQENKVPIELLEGIGSLTIKEEDGSTRFLGMSSGSAYFTSADLSNSSDEEESLSPASPPDVAPVVTTYPFTKTGSSYPVSLGESKFMEIEHIRSHLPDREEGKRLAIIYWSHVSFMFEPLEENVFWNDYFVSAYTLESDNGSKLAAVFIILALGSLFDPKEPATYNATANQYFLLSQTALSAARFLSENTSAGAQTIQITGNFLLNTHKLQDGGETFFCLLGLGLRMVVTMGLHREPSKWGILNPELDRRRLLFYELMTLDRLQSFICGRPYVLHQTTFDTLPPTNVDDYQKTKFKIGIFLGKVIDEAFSIKIPTYITILSLGQELRDLYHASPTSMRSSVLPESALVIRPTGPPVLPIPKVSTDTIKVQMRQHTADMLFVQVLLYLHKPPFAQALIHYSEEPLQSPWAASVAAVVLEAGVYILALAKNWIKLDPVLCPRWWHIFFHSFAASVNYASLIIKSPGSLLARFSWDQLNIALQIFEDASVDGAPVATLLPRVKALRNDAYNSLQSVLTVSNKLPDPKPESNPSSPALLNDSSIAALGANTNLSRKPKKSPRVAGDLGPYTPSPPVTMPLTSQNQSYVNSNSTSEFNAYDYKSYTRPQETNTFENSFATSYPYPSIDNRDNQNSNEPPHSPNSLQQQVFIKQELAAQDLLQLHTQRVPSPPLHSRSQHQLQQDQRTQQQQHQSQQLHQQRQLQLQIQQQEQERLRHQQQELQQQIQMQYQQQQQYQGQQNSYLNNYSPTSTQQQQQSNSTSPFSHGISFPLLPHSFPPPQIHSTNNMNINNNNNSESNQNQNYSGPFPPAPFQSNWNSSGTLNGVGGIDNPVTTFPRQEQDWRLWNQMAGVQETGANSNNYQSSNQ